jgi:hypothetical protein
MLEKYALIVALSIISEGAAAAPDSVIFPAMVFSDIGDIVHVEGTLTGDGIGYPTNYQTLTCEKETGECLATHIDSEGMLVFWEGLPEHLTIRAWTAAEIIAETSVPCGKPPEARLKADWQSSAFTTWIIDRVGQTAEVTEHVCLGPKTYHWKIEDPVYWKQAHRELGPKKP